MSKNGIIYKVTGVIVPIILFVSLSSPILLSNSRMGDGQIFSIPLSLILLPFLLCYQTFKKNKNSYPIGFRVLFFFFIAWTIILSVYSMMFFSISSLLYALQWIIPFLFLFFYSKINTYDNLITFLNGFFIGTMFSNLYIFIAGIIELLLFGIGNGRITQNLILPGFYQLYVYVPTAIAYTTLISVSAIRAGLISFGRFWTIILYLTSFCSIIFTGSREGLLVYLMGLLGFYILKNRKTIVLKLTIIIIVLVALLGSVDYFIDKMSKSDIMMLQKYAQLNDDEKQFAGRDGAIEKALEIIDQRPLVGTAMLPADYYSLGVGEFSSAHNYYMDAYVWGGFFYFIVVVGIFLFILYQSIKNIILNMKRSSHLVKFCFDMSCLLIIYILVSNNINVPMKQPLTGAISSFLIYCSLCFNKITIGMSKELLIVKKNE